MKRQKSFTTNLLEKLFKDSRKPPKPLIKLKKLQGFHELYKGFRDQPVAF